MEKSLECLLLVSISTPLLTVSGIGGEHLKAELGVWSRKGIKYVMQSRALPTPPVHHVSV